MTYRKPLLVVGMFLLLFCCGCKSSSLSKEGEACTRTADCSPETVCVDFVCVNEAQPSSSSDYSMLIWQELASGEVMTWQQAISYCEELSVKGHRDWRLPTIGELRSLVRGCTDSETDGLCGVTDLCLTYECRDLEICFNCSYQNGPAAGCYWSDSLQGICDAYWSSSRADDDKRFAWQIYFNHATFNMALVSKQARARCVREDEDSDLDTSDGDRVDGDGEDVLLSYPMAIDYCENLVLDEQADWRLPSIDELRSLLRGCPSTQSDGSCTVTEDCRLATCLENEACTKCNAAGGPNDGCYWPDAISGNCRSYWSYSTVVEESTDSWSIDFNTGAIEAVDWFTPKSVRCVREELIVDGDGYYINRVDGDEMNTENAWFDSASGLTWQSPPKQSR